MTTRHKEALAGYLFATPWIVGFLAFLAYPLGASLYYSFTDFSVLREPVFVGASNYQDLASDELFWKTLQNTLVYAGLALPLGLVVSVSVALLLDTKIKGMAFYRTAIFIPSLVPMIAIAMIWLWMFNGERGLVNELLGLTGVKPPNWLGDPMWSKPALALIGVWGVGNAVVIYLAGLQDVPRSLYEAADLDGASPWKKTRFVTLPLISPVIQFNLITGIIGALQVFAVPYVMFPGGSPARSTYFYTMYLFDNAFRYQKMGYACAMAWILFLLIFGLTMFALRVSEKRVHYGGL